MLKKHSQLFEGLFIASDLAVVSVAWLLSYWLRFGTGLIDISKGVPPFGDYLRMLIFVWLIWAFMFRRAKLYRPMRGAGRLREALRVIRANATSVVLLMAMTYLFWEKSVPFSRAVFVIFLFFSTVLLIGSRSLIRVVLREMRRRGYNLRYALVVGAGSLAQKVARRMLANPEYGVELIGCLTSDEARVLARRGAYVRAVNEPAYTNGHPVENGWRVDQLNGNGETNSELRVDEDIVAVGENIGGAPVIGTYSDLPELLLRGGIDQIIVALPLNDHARMEAVISSIGDAVVDVRIVPDFHKFVQLGSLVEEFDGLPVMSLASTPLTGLNRVLKRAWDLFFGSLIFTAALPLMALIALAVKLTSRGPIFYSQERVGLDGRSFNILKFRTMYTDAEAAGARFAVRGDPRVTPLGRFLRQFSLDELPQLVNVIMGTMSLVGPRPERPVFIEEFRKRVPRYMLRHKVQAGMTGWAQVNGWRGNTSISRRIEHDLYYIEHWSLSLDLKILGLTLISGFRDRNAY